MVWSSPAQGNRPYAPSTRQTVCIVVTPSPENGIFRSLCFQSLTHSFAGVFSTTPLQSYSSALFAQNTGGGYTPEIRLMLSRVCVLLPRAYSAMRHSLVPIGSHRRKFLPPNVFLSHHSRLVTRHYLLSSSRWCPRCRSVGAPLFFNGKRSLSRFSSYRCQTFFLTTRGGTPTPSIQCATP
jgi:hypothetical protein